MADRGGTDLLTRLGDKGEEAFGKLVHKAPGGDTVAQLVHAVREQVDHLQHRLRGVDLLEKKVARLEKRVAELEGKGPAKAAKPAAKRAAPKRTATKRAPAKRAPANTAAAVQAAGAAAERAAAAATKPPDAT